MLTWTQKRRLCWVHQRPLLPATKHGRCWRCEFSTPTLTNAYAYCKFMDKPMVYNNDPIMCQRFVRRK